MELDKLFIFNKMPYKTQQILKYKYKTLNELLNNLDFKGDKIDILIQQWHSLEEAIFILLWEKHSDEYNKRNKN